MTKYIRKRLNDLRLARGLFWKRTTPPIPYRDLAIVTACILTYAGVAHVDTLQQRVAKWESERVEYESYRDVVLQVMNGETRFQAGNELFECRGGPLGVGI